jgi:hypothetical protein
LAGFLVQELKEVPPAPAPTPKPILTPIEDDEPVHSMPEKPQEKKDSSGQEKTKVYLDKIKQLKHNPALLGALCCLIIAAGINFFSNFLFFLWGPLYLVVFILGIVAIVQQKVGKGIGFIVASILLPAFICTANIIIVPMAMMGLSTKIAHAEKEARLAELTERDLLSPSSQEPSRKSVSLRSNSVSSPVAEKPSIDQHRQEMINLTKSISRPSEKYILNMLQQVVLVEKTKAVRNNSQDYCRIEIFERQLHNNTDINMYQKEIELGLLTKVGQSLRPTTRARQVNGTYEYSYVPDKVVRILPPSYDQKTDAIDCVVTYNVSLHGIPKYVLDNAHVLNRWAKWRQSGFINIYNLKLTDSRSITFFWSQSRREWMLKYDGAIYDYQPDFKFEAIDNEITFAPEAIDPAPQVAAVPVVPSRPPVATLSPPTTPGVLVVPSSPDQPMQTQISDKDGDGFPDYYEVARNTDPNNPLSHPPLAERLFVRSILQMKMGVMLKGLQMTGNNRSNWNIQLDLVEGGRVQTVMVKLNSTVTVDGKQYKIIDCVPKKEKIFDEKLKMEVEKDLSEVTLQAMNNNDKVVMVLREPVFSPQSKAYLRDISTGRYYNHMIDETFTIGDSKTGTEVYKVLSIDYRLNQVQLMNMKDNSIIEVSTVKRFEYNTPGQMTKHSGRVGPDMPSSSPQIYHQPWERLELSSVSVSEKPYSVGFEKVIVLSSNKYQWRARLKFTAASGRFLSRSPRIEEDLTIAGDTYSIADIHSQVKSDFADGNVVSLQDAFTEAVNGRKSGSFQSKSANFIELINKTTGEKKKIHEGQTVKFNDYKAHLYNKDTRKSLGELSVGDKFTVEHNGETFEYKVYASTS